MNKNDIKYKLTNKLENKCWRNVHSVVGIKMIRKLEKELSTVVFERFYCLYTGNVIRQLAKDNDIEI